MTKPLTIECEFHFERWKHGARKVMEPGPEPERPKVTGRIPRVARLMALAIKYDGLLRTGVVETYSDIARLGHVTVARVCQIMNLINLAPDIQEEILQLPRTESGLDPIIVMQLQPVASTPDWRKQRRMWAELQESQS